MRLQISPPSQSFATTSDNINCRLQSSVCLRSTKPHTRTLVVDMPGTNIKLLEDEWEPKRSIVSFTTPTSSDESRPSKALPPASKSLLPKKSSFRKSIMGKFKKEKTVTSSDLSSKALHPQLKPIPPISPVPNIIMTPASFEDSKPSSLSVAIDMIEINNLCDTIATYRTDSKQCCRLKGEEGSFALQPLGATDIGDTISLEEILRKESKISLTRRQRYNIALTLASSHLQLSSTSWISSQWRKSDIFFIRRSSNPDEIYLDKPYVTRNFMPNLLDTDHPQDHSLSNLGIMLLELCFGTALEDHQLRKKYPSSSTPNMFSDKAAALEWSHRAVEEAGPEFADAILWCLHNMPGSGESDNKLEKRREELFVKVVEPLKYCCDRFNTARI
ncbi:hypothetical protein HYALB_00006686 [Hymenoscyphus albidus]|uniref:DUF7580 domain-containing protein n=1 Tax=Hymenoscyphus albidus TaxID=595503 RepID=A0A9N9LLX1_9HELO|nr:hypothetical protein HYALB_00006686 [Hymenoscyphus albidus]